MAEGPIPANAESDGNHSSQTDDLTEKRDRMTLPTPRGTAFRRSAALILIAAFALAGLAASAAGSSSSRPAAVPARAGSGVIVRARAGHEAAAAALVAKLGG